jgi:hypothetical protein
MVLNGERYPPHSPAPEPTRTPHSDYNSITLVGEHERGGRLRVRTVDSVISTNDSVALWARTVTRRHFKANRDELDGLVTSTVPEYDAAVAAELSNFESAVSSTIAAYDAEHSDPAFQKTGHPRVRVALFWIFFLATAGGFGVMLPLGARTAGGSEFPDSSWKYLVVLSFALFALAVATQLVRAFPVRPGIPPRKDLAWLPVGFGIPALAVMILRVKQDIGVDPLWVALTAAVLSVSLVYCLSRLVRRSRHKELARVIDSADDLRMSTLSDKILALGEHHGERIVEIFRSLPPMDRETLNAAFSDAAVVLRDRGFIRQARPHDREHDTRNARGRLTAVPGLLTLSRRIAEVWKPDVMIYTRRRRLQWLVSGWELEPRFGRRSPTSTARASAPNRRSR